MKEEQRGGSRRLSTPSGIREALEAHGFSFSKALGQNFLADTNIVEKIVSESEVEGRLVIEIGPGFGSMTEVLCDVAESVIAIEKDRRIPEVLEKLVPADNLEIVCADVLKTDLDELIRAKLGFDSAVVVANLPYYITSPVIMHVLEHAQLVDRIVVMVQKEVADRIMDRKDRGALTIATAYYAEKRRIMDVGRRSFIPAPKVDSAVVRMDRIPPRLEPEQEALFWKILRAIYSSRRKTMLNCLDSLKLMDKKRLKDVIIESGYMSNVRGEQLSAEELIELTRRMM